MLLPASFHTRRAPLLAGLTALLFPLSTGTVHAQTAGAPPTARRTVTRSAIEFSEDDKKLLLGYKLSPDRLTQFETTTRKLQEAAKRDPSMRAQFEAVGAAAKGRSLADAIARIESTASPAVAALFKEANTTARDYVLTSFSLVNAAMNSGEVTPPAYVPTENVAFFRSNRSRIETDFRSFAGGK